MVPQTHVVTLKKLHINDNIIFVSISRIEIQRAFKTEGMFCLKRMLTIRFVKLRLAYPSLAMHLPNNGSSQIRIYSF